MNTSPRVAVSIDGYIATVTLKRPEAHNGLDLQMFEQLRAAAVQLRAASDVRAVVLHGEGPSFCAGLDFRAFGADSSMGRKLFLKWPWRKSNLAQGVAQVWRELPIPVIAAVHGNCFGGGLQIAAACDFRYSRADAKWSVMESKWGIIPDMSGTLALRQLMRLDVAQELTMTARVIDGNEAERVGLVTRLCEDPLADAYALANELSLRSPDAMAASKVLFRGTWTASEWRALLVERWVQIRLLGRKNQRIAVKNGTQRDKSVGPKSFVPRSRWW